MKQKLLSILDFLFGIILGQSGYFLSHMPILKYLRGAIRKFYRKFIQPLHNYVQTISININDNLIFKLNLIVAWGGLEYELLFNHIFEKEIVDYCLSNIKDKELVLDIGANIGYHTVLFAKSINPSVRVISYEPVKKTFEILQSNVELNSLTNVDLNNFALGSKNESMVININDEPGWNSLVHNNPNSKSETIEISKGDDILKDKNKKVFIKIDTEGFELEVLKGLVEFIKSNNCTIIFEFTPEFYIELYKSADNAIKKLSEILTETGYSKILNIEENQYFINDIKSLQEAFNLDQAYLALIH